MSAPRRSACHPNRRHWKISTHAAPRTPVQHKARLIVDEHVRNAYGDAIGVAAFVTLLGIPFSLTMRRRPGEAASPEMAAAAAAAAG